MNEINFAGHIPAYIRQKACSIIEQITVTPSSFGKKIPGLYGARTCRLNSNYRLLFMEKNYYFIGNHDLYEQRLKLLRKKGAHHANCL